MKRIACFVVGCLIASMFVTTGCGNGKSEQAPVDSDSVNMAANVPDTTVYGICGEGSAMHMLELITDEGDTMLFLKALEEMGAADVVGGLMTGDRIAVVGHSVGDEMVTDQAVNLTTLIGKWTSIDKNFEIQEGGVVKSHVAAETQPWTAWKIYNGKLVLNRDTFSVARLDADSLFLENNQGIFTYKRQK